MYLPCLILNFAVSFLLSLPAPPSFFGFFYHFIFPPSFVCNSSPSSRPPFLNTYLFSCPSFLLSSSLPSPFLCSTGHPILNHKPVTKATAQHDRKQQLHTHTHTHTHTPHLSSLYCLVVLFLYMWLRSLTSCWDNNRHVVHGRFRPSGRLTGSDREDADVFSARSSYSTIERWYNHPMKSLYAPDEIQMPAVISV